MEGVDFYRFTLLCTHSINQRVEMSAPLCETMLLSFTRHHLSSVAPLGKSGGQRQGGGETESRGVWSMCHLKNIPVPNRPLLTYKDTQSDTDGGGHETVQPKG